MKYNQKLSLTLYLNLTYLINLDEFLLQDQRRGIIENYYNAQANPKIHHNKEIFSQHHSKQAENYLVEFDRLYSCNLDLNQS
jgi:hypothetical protein